MKCYIKLAGVALIAGAALALLFKLSGETPGTLSAGNETATTSPTPAEMRATTAESQVAHPAPASPNATPSDPWTQRLQAAYTADPAKVNQHVLEDFRTWMNSPDRDLTRGIELAKLRRESLNALARLKPQQAWEFFIPRSERTGLPQEILALLEEPVEAVGDWQPFAVCMDPNLAFSMYYEATLNGADQPEYALPVGNLVNAGNPKQIPLHGYRLDGIAIYDTEEQFADALSPDPEDGSGGTAEAPLESTTGMRDSLPFLTRPTDNRNEGWRTAIYMRTEWNGWANGQSESAAYSQWRTVNDLMMRNSKGRYQILVTVTPVIDMKTHAAAYGYSPDITNHDVGSLRAAVKAVAQQHYGYTMSDYGHKIIYWQNGPGDFGGLASLPGDEISMKTTSASTAYHELGHNMNFFHSSFLKDQDAEDNYSGNIELGTREEYGNPFDHMGHFSCVGGLASFDQSLFCAAACRRWNWLHNDEIFSYREPGTFRIWAFDDDTVQQDRRYAIEFARTDSKQYYVSYYRSVTKGPNANAHSNGARLEVMGVNGGFNQPSLIDATYWSKHERQDACIPIGWTFQDQEEGLFITPLGRATDRSWMDVHVHQGFDSSNRPPVISSFTASTTTPGTGANVNFAVTASDPDGDALAYHWYFDDDDWHRNLNTNATSFSWSSAGYRSVLCTITDMKGGAATRRILVTVGSPSTRYITGTVLDSWGKPVGSVPVDNGMPMTDDGDTLIAGIRSTLTDTNGVYVLTGLANGSYNPAARVYGDAGDRANGSNPVTVSGANVTGIDFVLRAAEIIPSATQIAEDGGTATFTIQRSASFTGNLNLPVRSIGKAVLGTDFTLTPPPDSNGEYNLPNGVSSINITVTGLPDTATEGPEDITLTFELNRNLSLPVPMQASIWINDAETALPRVRLSPVGRLIPENGGTEKFRITRFGATNAPLTVNLTTSDTAIHGMDYTIIGGLAQVIPAGASFLDVTVQGINDSETEGRELFHVNLGNGSYVKDSQQAARLYVVDDDIAVVSVTAIDPIATEADPSNTAIFRVSRTGDLQDALYVEYNALGTALHGTDYQALKGDLVIPIGQSYVDIPIVPIADTFADEGETVQLWLTSSEADCHLGNYVASASIILGQLPADPSPEPGVADLFYDTFLRLNNNNVDAEIAGMSGSLVGSLGAGRAYFEGYEGSGTADSIQIKSGKLQMATGSGMSESGIMHNFVDQSIINAGGFSVEIKVDEINTTTPLADRYAGFGVGLTASEAATGNDYIAAGSFRGNNSGIIGTADFFVELDRQNNVKVWRYGTLLATMPVGVGTGILRAEFACAGFSTANTVTVSVFLNGTPVDINPANGSSVTQTFNWQNNNANYIGLSCRASAYVTLDDLFIKTLNALTLFADTFSRPDNTDADVEVGGMTGGLLGVIGVDAAYYEGHEGSGTPDSIQVNQARLRMATGVGMSENGLMHNFIDADIVAAGGFSIEMKVAEINSTSTFNDLANRYAGFGVGLTQAEAAGGADIASTNSFRGRSGVTGRADFFVEVDLNNNVKVWRYGSLLATVPVGTNAGTLTAGFACSGFSTADTVTAIIYFNGQLLDINPTDPNSVMQTFNWQFNNANYIGLSCRASDYVDLDYVAIRTLPLHYALFAQHAFALGLTGANAAPNADADGDGESNFIEWAKGTSLTVSNAPGKLLTPVAATNGVFVFNQRRLANAAATGVRYPVYYSTNLVDWLQFTPVQLGTTPVPGNSAYEDATLQADESITVGKNALFVRGAIAP